MPLHPQAQALIDQLAGSSALDLDRLSAREFRERFAIPTPADPGPEMARIEDVVIAGADGQPMSVRIYQPRHEGRLPITLYCHGGGFVIGDPATTDSICRMLAAGARTLIVSPDYRLAPEARFPPGLDDAWAALMWARAHAAALGGDATRMAVAGDSSGGNFAAAMALMARDRGIALIHQLLLYPVMDNDFSTASYREFAEGYFLTARMMRWYGAQYLDDPARAADPRVSPARADTLAGLPSATILTAEYDVLRDEAEDYARRLRDAGVAVKAMRWPGQIHGFLLGLGALDDAREALDAMSRQLRDALW